MLRFLAVCQKTVDFPCFLPSEPSKWGEHRHPLASLCKWHILLAEFGNKKPSFIFRWRCRNCWKPAKPRKSCILPVNAPFPAPLFTALDFPWFCHRSRRNGGNPEIDPRPYLNGTFCKQNLVTEKPSTNFPLEMSKLLETSKTAKIVQFAGESSVFQQFSERTMDFPFLQPY